jgi:hypothetical protein
LTFKITRLDSGLVQEPGGSLPSSAEIAAHGGKLSLFPDISTRFFLFSRCHTYGFGLSAFRGEALPFTNFPKSLSIIFLTVPQEKPEPPSEGSY